jgi:hypothetical protein
VGVTVRRASSHLDRWDALPGETRWVDYSCQHAGEELLVYVHTFRRVRERFDSSSDVLLWKPATTRLAHRYAAGQWDAVLRGEREWPPTELAYVARRRRGSALGRERP